MNSYIKDPLTNDSARVQNNRLLTYSVSETDFKVSSNLGQSFNVNTGTINLTTASESALLYMKNTSTEEYIIDTIFFLFGNSTGGSGDAFCKILRNPTAGTIVSGAVDAEMPGINRNFGSSISLDADTFKGAEGNTLTDGTTYITTIFNQAPTRVGIVQNGLILTPGASVGVTFTPATGNASLNIQIAVSIYKRTFE